MIKAISTPQIIKEWKNTFEEYKSQLQPNKKTANEVIEYLRNKYPLEENTLDNMKQVVIDNISMNSAFAEKIPQGNQLRPIVFSIPNRDRAVILYKKQEDIFKDITIMVGMEVETGYVSVEGSGELFSEIVAFQGLDEKDLNNYYLVANYIDCLKKYNLLGDILK